MKKSFPKLSRDEQAEVVRPLMEAGDSYSSVANKLGVKRGRIAGICRDYNIKTTRSAGFAELPKSSSGVVLRLAASEATQCIARVGSRQCWFVKEPGSGYCALPAHQALEKRGRS